MKKVQHTIELTHEEKVKTEEEELRIKRDEYMLNMKANLNYQYLMNNFKGLILSVWIVFILTIFFIWIIYGYFWIDQKTSIPQNPIALIIIFSWLFITQIYAWNRFVVYKSIEALCLKEIGYFPWWRWYGSNNKGLLKKCIYWAWLKYLMQIISMLWYFIWFVGIWFSFSQIIVYFCFILISYFHFTVIYSIFYDSILVLFGIIPLWMLAYYILYTNKDNRDITIKPPWYNSNIFYDSRDNRIITMNTYIILSLFLTLSM